MGSSKDADNGLSEERLRAVNFLRNPSSEDRVIDLCYPFVSYGRYFLEKKKSGIDLNNVILRLKYLSSSVVRHTRDPSASRSLIDLMLEYGRDIYMSEVIDEENIDLASFLYCRSFNNQIESGLFEVD